MPHSSTPTRLSSFSMPRAKMLLLLASLSPLADSWVFLLSRLLDSFVAYSQHVRSQIGCRRFPIRETPTISSECSSWSGSPGRVTGL